MFESLLCRCRRCLRQGSFPDGFINSQGLCQQCADKEAQAKAATVFNAAIGQCARCGGDHTSESMPFFPFARPVTGEDGKLQATHWGVCPVTAEPLLLLIIEESAGEPSSSPSSEAVSHAAQDGPAT